jgi:exonuclease 3'-5' domain-containing protein 2
MHLSFDRYKTFFTLVNTLFGVDKSYLFDRLCDKEIFMYDNCRLLSPEGKFMAFCDRKRYDWYLKKNLAVKIDDKTIQLTFIPKGTGYRLDSEFLLTERANVCVVCGTEHNLTKHHVVPTRYRKHFPLEIKNHASFDVLTLCEEHHHEYEEHSNNFSKELMKKHDLDELAKKYKEKYTNLGLIATFLDAGDSMPEKAKEKLLEKIKVVFHDDSITRKQLPVILANNKEFIDGYYDAIHVKLIEIYGYVEFVKMWRKHFIDYAKPQFLPDSWKKEYDDIKSIIVT